MAILVTYQIRTGRESPERDSESLSVLAAQFGAIFTIPSLRTILPDIPPTGKLVIVRLSGSNYQVSFLACVFGVVISKNIMRHANWKTDLVAIIPNIFIITFTVRDDPLDCTRLTSSQGSALLTILAAKKLRGAKQTPLDKLERKEEAVESVRIDSSYGRASPFAFPLPAL